MIVLRHCVLLMLFLSSAQAEILPFGEPYSDAILSSLREGKMLVKSKVSSHQEKGPNNTVLKKQIFDFEMLAYHPRACRLALRKISMYESYKDFISFVAVSDYDVKSQKWSVTVDHTLFYGKMYLALTFPRVKEAGIYPFVFLENSSMPGMTGRFILNDYKGGCLVDLKSHYDGPTTTFPDTIFQIITSTLGRLGMEKLIRISTL